MELKYKTCDLNIILDQFKQFKLVKLWFKFFIHLNFASGSSIFCENLGCKDAALQSILF